MLFGGQSYVCAFGYNTASQGVLRCAYILIIWRAILMKQLCKLCSKLNFRNWYEALLSWTQCGEYRLCDSKNICVHGICWNHHLWIPLPKVYSLYVSITRLHFSHVSKRLQYFAGLCFCRSLMFLFAFLQCIHEQMHLWDYTNGRVLSQYGSFKQYGCKFLQLIYHICFKYDLGQKYYASQVQPERGLNSWPPDRDGIFHVAEMCVL